MTVHMRLKLLCFMFENLWSMDVIVGSVGNYYVFHQRIWSHVRLET
jgi:hypothetical protein